MLSTFKCLRLVIPVFLSFNRGVFTFLKIIFEKYFLEDNTKTQYHPVMDFEAFVLNELFYSKKTVSVAGWNKKGARRPERAGILSKLNS